MGNVAKKQAKAKKRRKRLRDRHPVKGLRSLGERLTKPSHGIPDKVKDRLAKYEQRKTSITWVAVGFGGFIALNAGAFSALVLGPAPSELRAAIVTLIISAGITLAFARSNFEWAATSLRNAGLKDDDDIPKDNKAIAWPSRAEALWAVSLWLLTFIGALYLASVWYAAASS